MDNIDRIGRIEAIALLITVIANNIIFNIPNIILNFSGTGSWLSIIYLSIITIIFIIIISKLLKPFVQADIVDISEFIGGKFLKFLIGIAYIFLFISFSAACLRYLVNSIHLIYFNNTPILYLMLLFLIPIVIANKHGIKAISGTNIIFVPIAMVSIIILLLAASKDFVWQRLFPIFGYGAKNLFLTQLPNIAAFNVIAYLYFIRPFLKQENNFKTISIICIIVCFIYLFLSIVSLLMTYPFITETDETLSLYLLTRLITFGAFFERVDAIFIFLWILALLSFLSFNVFLIISTIKKLFNLKNSSELSYSISAILLGLALSFTNIASVKVFNREFYRYYTCILVFIVSFMIIIFAYIKKRKQGVRNETK